MKRKKLIISILVGAAVAGAAFYLLGTANGKKELSRLKKTGSATAGTFKTLKKEVARNMKQARREEEVKALKAYMREALAT
jgi:gas vesicle protein